MTNDRTPSHQHLHLEPAQEELLVALVEAARSVPQDQRQMFRGMRLHSTGRDVAVLHHPGFPGRMREAYPGDIAQLIGAGLLISHPSKDYKFDVASAGFGYYEALQERRGESVARVEQAVRSMIESGGFRTRHPLAYAKWAEAERQLWMSETTASATVIGHLCREAHQAFATSMLQQHPVEDAPVALEQSKARVGAVLADLAGDSQTIRSFVIALGNYWEAVIDLAQRQEHGATAAGSFVGWSDSRRLVFSTLYAMSEIDRLL